MRQAAGRAGEERPRRPVPPPPRPGSAQRKWFSGTPAPTLGMVMSEPIAPISAPLSMQPATAAGSKARCGPRRPGPAQRKGFIGTPAPTLGRVMSGPIAPMSAPLSMQRAAAAGAKAGGGPRRPGLLSGKGSAGASAGARQSGVGTDRHHIRAVIHAARRRGGVEGEGRPSPPRPAQRKWFSRAPAPALSRVMSEPIATMSAP